MFFASFAFALAILAGLYALLLGFDKRQAACPICKQPMVNADFDDPSFHWCENIYCKEGRDNLTAALEGFDSLDPFASETGQGPWTQQGVDDHSRELDEFGVIPGAEGWEVYARALRGSNASVVKCTRIYARFMGWDQCGILPEKYSDPTYPRCPGCKTPAAWVGQDGECLCTNPRCAAADPQSRV